MRRGKEKDERIVDMYLRVNSKKIQVLVSYVNNITQNSISPLPLLKQVGFYLPPSQKEKGSGA